MQLGLPSTTQLPGWEVPQKRQELRMASKLARLEASGPRSVTSDRTIALPPDAEDDADGTLLSQQTGRCRAPVLIRASCGMARLWFTEPASATRWMKASRADP